MADTAAYSIKTHAAVPQKAPYGVEVEAGKDYAFCVCGLSKNQPWCDGSHRAYNEEHKTTFRPLHFTPKESGQVRLCGCKQSKNLPYCDGTHRTATD